MAGDRMNVIFAQKGKDGKNYWKTVGSAWPRDDGGMSVSLFAMPAPQDGEFRFLIVQDDGERKSAGGGYDSGRRSGATRSAGKGRGPQEDFDDEIPF